MSRDNIILSVSNLLVALPIQAAWKLNKYWECAMFAGIAIASSLQHITDTKHNRIGLFPGAYAFLWLDRMFHI